MLKLSSTPQQMVQEITEDKPHLTYWVKRKEAEIRQWVQDTKDQPGTQVRWGIDYTSKNGNHWKTFFVQHKQIQGHTIVAMVPFIMYETVGSLGIFVPLNQDQGTNTQSCGGCLLYTSHFFRRLCERTGVDYGSKEMLMRFVLATSEFTTHPVKINAQGQQEIIIEMVGGQGMGIRLQDEPMVAEIRTYLHESQLNRQQQKTFEACHEETQRRTPIEEVIPHLQAGCRQLFEAAGYVSKEDYAWWERCKDRCAILFLEAARGWDPSSQPIIDQTYRQLTSAIAHAMSIPNFDPQRIERQLYTLSQESPTLNKELRTSQQPSLTNLSTPIRKWRR